MRCLLFLSLFISALTLCLPVQAILLNDPDNHSLFAEDLTNPCVGRLNSGSGVAISPTFIITANHFNYGSVFEFEGRNYKLGTSGSASYAHPSEDIRLIKLGVNPDTGLQQIMHTWCPLDEEVAHAEPGETIHERYTHVHIAGTGWQADADRNVLKVRGLVWALGSLAVDTGGDYKSGFFIYIFYIWLRHFRAI